jgi:hypothetical protein
VYKYTPSLRLVHIITPLRKPALVDKTTLMGGVIRTLPPEFVGNSRRGHCV